MTDVDFAKLIASRRRHRLLASSAALALVVSGCATTGSVSPAATGDLLTCAPHPPSPVSDNTNEADTQRDVGLYIIDLTAAGEDCRQKLGAVRDILEPKR